MMPSMVDENGMPIATPPPDSYPQQQSMVRPDGTGEPSQQDLDRAFPPQQPPYPQQQQQQQQQQAPNPPPRQPQQQPESEPPADSSQPRPYTP
jgi:penicillin-binding protein 1A